MPVHVQQRADDHRQRHRAAIRPGHQERREAVTATKPSAQPIDLGAETIPTVSVDRVTPIRPLSRRNPIVTLIHVTKVVQFECLFNAALGALQGRHSSLPGKRSIPAEWYRSR